MRQIEFNGLITATLGNNLRWTSKDKPTQRMLNTYAEIQTLEHTTANGDLRAYVFGRTVEHFKPTKVTDTDDPPTAEEGVEY
jgi:hypothetical protein|tara:strand:- start:169 stop:414 length:246 start_codon:yes stop_codon:yes gene_type:complete